MKRIAIVGCRPPRTSDPADDAIYRAIVMGVQHYVRELPVGTTVVSGGADGVDFVAKVTAEARLLPTITHLPDYDRFGRRAPLERNTLIVRDADEVVAFPAPWSRGTWDTVRKARGEGKPVDVREVSR